MTSAASTILYGPDQGWQAMPGLSDADNEWSIDGYDRPIQADCVLCGWSTPELASAFSDIATRTEDEYNAMRDKPPVLDSTDMFVLRRHPGATGACRQIESSETSSTTLATRSCIAAGSPESSLDSFLNALLAAKAAKEQGQRAVSVLQGIAIALARNRRGEPITMVPS